MKCISSILKSINRICATGITQMALLCTFGDSVGSPEERAEQAGFKLHEIYQDIEQMEYDVNWQDAVGALQSPNRANNLRFTFYSNGFSVQVRDPQLEVDLPKDWTVCFSLESYGPNNPINPLIEPTASKTNNAVR